MEIGREDRVRMERAHVRAWPASRTADIDGWLWRSSGGGSQRANSVSTIDFRGDDVAASIREIEARYRAIGAPARFQTFDETSPPGLPDALRQRGYRQSDPTTTMFKRIQSPHAPTHEARGIEIRNDPWPEWRQVYLGEITENRRAANTLILDRIPGPRAFFGCHRDNHVVATALSVIGFGCAVIECVATRADHRRQGAGRAVLVALEDWAAQNDVAWIGLQVVSSNAPAIALYAGLDYEIGATNSFWLKPETD